MEYEGRPVVRVLIGLFSTFGDRELGLLQGRGWVEIRLWAGARAASQKLRVEDLHQQLTGGSGSTGCDSFTTSSSEESNSAFLATTTVTQDVLYIVTVL